MRKKCHDYLANPSAALLAELTTMEQNWVNAIEEGKIKKPAAPKPAAAASGSKPKSK